MKSYVIAHRNDVFIKQDMYKYVSGFLLGDGGLWKHKSTRLTNYRQPKPIQAIYHQSQIVTHLDYVLWQAKILSQITRVRLLFIESHGMHKQSTRLATLSHPLYTDLYDRWYSMGRKTVPYHDAQAITIETLAYWIQDDGYLDNYSKTSYRIGICSESFTEAENKMLRDIVADKLNVHMNIRRYRNKVRLELNRKQTDALIPQIEPFVAPSFYYKIRKSPTIEIVASWYAKYQDDGIVRTLLKDNDLYRNVINS